MQRVPAAWRVTGDSSTQERRLRAASDDTLLLWMRHDRVGPFGELYRRHRPEALRYARALSSRHLRHGSPDDLVAEAMRKVLSAVINGRGPRTGFRPYLIATMRTVAFREATRSRPDKAAVVQEARFHPAADDLVDTSVATAALRSLPGPSQRILWLTEALQLPAADAAARLGMDPTAVRVAAMRAREALRVAYVRQFLPSPTDRTCKRAVAHLARRAVANLSPRQSAALDTHLGCCTECRRAAELVDDELGHWPRQQPGATLTRGVTPRRDATAKSAG